MKLWIPFSMKTSWVSGMVVVGCLMVYGCEEQKPPVSSSVNEQTQAETNQQRLMKAVPAPVLNYSLERENIAKRIKECDDPNRVSYVYLIGPMGQVISFFTMKGKITSLNATLIGCQQIINDPYARGEGFRQGLVLEGPDLDGTYGKNPDGIFFYTAEGIRIEWNGLYLWVGQPLKISTPPILIYDVTEKPSGP